MIHGWWNAWAPPSTIPYFWACHATVAWTRDVGDAACQLAGVGVALLKKKHSIMVWFRSPRTQGIEQQRVKGHHTADTVTRKRRKLDSLEQNQPPRKKSRPSSTCSKSRIKCKMLERESDDEGSSNIDDGAARSASNASLPYLGGVGVCNLDRNEEADRPG